jgi:alkylhydroperoxidase family enzyme
VTAERLGSAQGVVDDIDAAPIDRQMKPVLRYARKVTQSPGGVAQVDAEVLFAEGWNETALYHAVAATALFNFMNRLVEGLGIGLDPAYVKPAAERLADRAHLPLIAMLR